MSEKRKMRKVCILLLKQTRFTVAKRRGECLSEKSDFNSVVQKIDSKLMVLTIRPCSIDLLEYN